MLTRVSSIWLKLLGRHGRQLGGGVRHGIERLGPAAPLVEVELGRSQAN